MDNANAVHDFFFNSPRYMMRFDEYLISKKIDPGQFSKHDAKQYATWEAEYAQLHPESFTAQKKFLINAVRRRYRWSQ